jgi:uncharacterized protein (TIGR02646 family)
MRHIQKQAPPEEFIVHCKAGAGVTFDNAPKGAMRKALREEQQQLCAYCMCHLKAPTEEEMKIDHRVPRTAEADRVLDWSNLLGVCHGGEGRPYKQQTCDTRKGDKQIPFDPTLLQIEHQIRYTTTGRIEATDAKQQDSLDEILGLNNPELERARRETLDEFVRAMRRLKPDGAWSPMDLEAGLSSFRTTRKGATRAFVGIAEWYVRRKRRQTA